MQTTPLSLPALLAWLMTMTGAAGSQTADAFNPRAHLFGRRPDLAPALGQLAPVLPAFRIENVGDVSARPDAVVGRSTAGRPLVIAFGSYT